MLPIPNRNDSIATIVGIDPGSEMLGIATLNFDVDTFAIVGCDSHTYVGSKLEGSDWSGAIFGARYRRIQAHQDNLLRILREVQPLVVCSESPFANMLRPAAYGALVEVICGIREAVKQYDCWRPCYMLPPSSVKNSVGCKGNAKKDEVKEAVLKLAPLVNATWTDLNHMDEHSIDALAVAYCCYQLFKESKIEPIYI